MPSWEIEHTKWWCMLTLDITYAGTYRAGAKYISLKLIITDPARSPSSNSSLLTLDGGMGVLAGALGTGTNKAMDAVLQSPVGDQVARKSLGPKKKSGTSAWCGR